MALNGWILFLVACCFCLSSSLGREFERCQLVHELLKQKIPRHDLAAYMCIAEGESNYRTNAINRFNSDQSIDYGIFQINNRYWCEAPGSSNGCKLHCDRLIDDDIADDVRCALHIQRVHGLHAWVAYNNKCVNRNLDHHVAGCGV